MHCVCKQDTINSVAYRITVLRRHQQLQALRSDEVHVIIARTAEQPDQYGKLSMQKKNKDMQ